MTRHEDLRRTLSGMTPQQRAALDRRLAERRARLAEAIPALPRSGSTDRFPASPGQERLYFLHELDPDSTAYVMPVTLTLRGRLDEEALVAALSAVVRRHEVLRTHFEADPRLGMVVQVVRPASDVVVDVARDTVREGDVPRLVEAMIRRRFDLTSGPLLRAGLWRTDSDGPEGTWVLGLVLHHIVMDGWSLGVLASDLTAAYASAKTGTDPDWPELPVQYSDFAAWQRDRLAGETLDPQRRYWREALTGASPLQLTGDRAPSGRRTFEGSSVALHLPPDLVTELTRVGKNEQATLFMVLLTAYAYVLHRWSGQKDVLVGAPVAGRSRPGTENLLGFFVNTLALRVDLDGADSFRELLRRTREVCLGGFAHQDLPFEQVVQERDRDRSNGRSDLVNALLTLTNVPLGPLRLAGIEVTLPKQPRAGTDVDVSLEFMPAEDGGLEGWLSYSTDLFDRRFADVMAEAVRCVLDAVVAAPDDVSLRTVPVMTDARREELLSVTSGRSTEPYEARTLQDWFTQRVDEAPDRVALVVDAPDQPSGVAATLDYGDLDARANRLAHWLRRNGLDTEERVGICLPRGTDLVTALLGVLKAGGVCVPLDPDHPRDRIEYILRESRPRLVLTDSRLRDGLDMAPGGGEDKTVDLIALDLLDDELSASPAMRPAVPVLPQGAAYILYTSGSTGRPKGVILTHHGIGNRLQGMGDAFRVTPDDAVLHKSPISSDPTLWEILVPLFRGARVVLAVPGRNTDPAYVHGVLARHRITACDFVPSLLQHVLARPGFGEAARSLRLILCGGEEMPPAMAEKVLELAPHIELLNDYGPSETCIDVTVQRVVAPVPKPVPIGHPVTGVELYVLDETGRLQPPGAPGELLIGGVQMSRGYLGLPGRTAASHVPHPFRSGARLYRTGDRVRWRPDGALDYLGRIDRQVKVRGYRVEPGEVEHALREHPGVEEAAVVARRREQGGHELAAYITVPGTMAEPPAADSLRRHLATRLPTPMQPASFTTLPGMPRNANGKIDYFALPEPVDAAPEGAAPVPPSNPLEEVLVGIWSQALGTKSLGVTDDFFDRGGHSLLATLVVSQVREMFRIELPLHFFIEAPTVTALAAMVRAQGAEAGVDTDRVAELVMRVQRMPAEEVVARLRG
ncbi:amino acid adenylation domain-containing protein [Streptomyces bottropensis]|uniref:non-ribosomal peptide synthetase n=1 Tax=Streptomyces bottropensis TaxID=42235 RepID=UPI0036992D91